MHAKFKDLTWEKGTVNLVNARSYGSIPRDAIRTSYGSYIVPNPAKLYLVLLAEDGRTITMDIVNVVKNINGWNKISEKRYNKLRARLENQTFLIDEDDNIVDLAGTVLF
jgi:hypothetical protein